MDRREVVPWLGMGTRVVIVRPRRATGRAWMRLQVRRRTWGWRTVSAFSIREEEATQHKARQWMHDYDEYPAGHFRRYP